VSDRELVVLGTASRAPARSRNHNGYLLLWDGEGLLFDPGGGTQFIMDTWLYDAAFELADGADMVCASPPFADTEARLAHQYGHLAAGYPGRIPAESRARFAYSFLPSYEFLPTLRAGRRPAARRASSDHVRRASRAGS
jgi:hypothetical protein